MDRAKIAQTVAEAFAPTLRYPVSEQDQERARVLFLGIAIGLGRTLGEFDRYRSYGFATVDEMIEWMLRA